MMPPEPGWSEAAPERMREAARAAASSAAECVHISHTGAALSSILGLLEAETRQHAQQREAETEGRPPFSSSESCFSTERARSAIALFVELAAYAIHPNTARRLFALFTATKDPALLSMFCRAIHRREESEPFPGAAPRRFFAFRGVLSSSPLPQLPGPCFGRDALSIWLWVRIDEDVDGGSLRYQVGSGKTAAYFASSSGDRRSVAGRTPQLVLEFAAVDDHTLELWLDSAPVAASADGGISESSELCNGGAGSSNPDTSGRHLTVVVSNQKAGMTSARCSRPLRCGRWNFVVVDLVAPTRRSLWPFQSAQLAAPTPLLTPEAYAKSLMSIYAASPQSACLHHEDIAVARSTIVAEVPVLADAAPSIADNHSKGLLTIYLNAIPQLHTKFPFPSPTNELKRWAVGAPIIQRSVASSSGSDSALPTSHRKGSSRPSASSPSPTASLPPSRTSPLRAQLGELLLLPCAAGGAAVARAGTWLRWTPGATLEEAARESGLCPSLVLSPDGLYMHGARVNLPSFMGVDDSRRGERSAGYRATADDEAKVDLSVSDFGNRPGNSGRVSRRAPTLLLGTYLDPIDALACMGGVRIILGLASVCLTAGTDAAHVPIHPSIDHVAHLNALERSQSQCTGEATLEHCVEMLRACVRKREAMARQCMSSRAFLVLALIMTRLSPPYLSLGVLRQLEGLYHDLAELEQGATAAAVVATMQAGGQDFAVPNHQNAAVVARGVSTVIRSGSGYGGRPADAEPPCGKARIGLGGAPQANHCARRADIASTLFIGDLDAEADALSAAPTLVYSTLRRQIFNLVIADFRIWQRSSDVTLQQEAARCLGRCAALGGHGCTAGPNRTPDPSTTRLSARGSNAVLRAEAVLEVEHVLLTLSCLYPYVDGIHASHIVRQRDSSGNPSCTSSSSVSQPLCTHTSASHGRSPPSKLPMCMQAAVVATRRELLHICNQLSPTAAEVGLLLDHVETRQHPQEKAELLLLLAKWISFSSGHTTEVERIALEPYGQDWCGRDKKDSTQTGSWNHDPRSNPFVGSHIAPSLTSSGLPLLDSKQAAARSTLCLEILASRGRPDFAIRHMATPHESLRVAALQLMLEVVVAIGKTSMGGSKSSLDVICEQLDAQVGAIERAVGKYELTPCVWRAMLRLASSPDSLEGCADTADIHTYFSLADMHRELSDLRNDRQLLVHDGVLRMMMALLRRDVANLSALGGDGSYGADARANTVTTTAFALATLHVCLSCAQHGRANAATLLRADIGAEAILSLALYGQGLTLDPTSIESSDVVPPPARFGRSGQGRGDFMHPTTNSFEVIDSDAQFGTSRVPLDRQDAVVEASLLQCGGFGVRRICLILRTSKPREYSSSMECAISNIRHLRAQCLQPYKCVPQLPQEPTLAVQIDLSPHPLVLDLALRTFAALHVLLLGMPKIPQWAIDEAALPSICSLVDAAVPAKERDFWRAAVCLHTLSVIEVGLLGNLAAPRDAPVATPRGPGEAFVHSKRKPSVTSEEGREQSCQPLLPGLVRLLAHIDAIVIRSASVWRVGESRTDDSLVEHRCSSNISIDIVEAEFDDLRRPSRDVARAKGDMHASHALGAQRSVFPSRAATTNILLDAIVGLLGALWEVDDTKQKSNCVSKTPMPRNISLPPRRSSVLLPPVALQDCSAVVLTQLCSDNSAFHLIVQLLLFSIIRKWQSSSAEDYGAPSLSEERACNLLLWLLLPVGIPHATAKVVLAFLHVVAALMIPSRVASDKSLDVRCVCGRDHDSLPGMNDGAAVGPDSLIGMPNVCIVRALWLSDRLLMTPGVTDHIWYELLPIAVLGCDEERQATPGLETGAALRASMHEDVLGAHYPPHYLSSQVLPHLLDSDAACRARILMAADQSAALLEVLHEADESIDRMWYATTRATDLTAALKQTSRPWTSQVTCKHFPSTAPIVAIPAANSSPPRTKSPGRASLPSDETFAQALPLGSQAPSVCMPPSLMDVQLEVSTAAARHWRKSLLAIAHDASLDIAPILHVVFGSAGPALDGTRAGAMLSALPIQWKLDKWEGPQTPAGGFVAASQRGQGERHNALHSGRMRLKVKRNWYPNDHRAASIKPPSSCATQVDESKSMDCQRNPTDGVDALGRSSDCLAPTLADETKLDSSSAHETVSINAIMKSCRITPNLPLPFILDVAAEEDEEGEEEGEELPASHEVKELSASHEVKTEEVQDTVAGAPTEVRRWAPFVEAPAGTDVRVDALLKTTTRDASTPRIANIASSPHGNESEKRRCASVTNVDSSVNTVVGVPSLCANDKNNDKLRGSKILSAVAGDPLLSVSCSLVRVSSLQRGHLEIFRDRINFIPSLEGTQGAGEMHADSGSGCRRNCHGANWIREGEPSLYEATRTRTWRLSRLQEILQRRYLLRRVALEFFMTCGTSYFITFDSGSVRRRVHASLVSLKPPALLPSSTFARWPGRNVLEKRYAQLIDDWQRWRISNLDYLLRLNTLAGRTYNDLTQYPVLPWVLSDYCSDDLDLNDPTVYRDLAKPIGALEPDRASKFRERFDSLKAEYEPARANAGDDGPGSVPPFHYGSHYSSAGIVLYFLLRMEPFTTEAIRLQNGRFDVADRLFRSIASTWSSCLADTADVKELIPEMFTCAECFRNENAFDLGVTQSGEALGDVVLPPWANGSADEFIRLNRAALESDYVSERLHLWIDLIFGWRQRGRPAEEALNVFYYLTYEGAVDVDALDPMHRVAVETQISNFGQTPAQLLTRPHPRRRPRSSADGPPVRMFARPSVVKAFGPWLIGNVRRGGSSERGRSASPEGEVDPVVFLSVLSNQDRLLTIQRSGRALLHQWQPLKPNKSCPFTFLPCTVPFMILPPMLTLGVHDNGVASNDLRNMQQASQPLSQSQSLQNTHEHSRRLPPPLGVAGNGCWLLSGGHADGSLQCTLIQMADIVVRRRCHCSPISCIDVGCDGATFATGAEDTTVVLWHLFGSERFTDILVGANTTVGNGKNCGGSYKSCPAGATAACGGSGSPVRMASPIALRVLCAHRGRITSICVSLELGLLISGSEPAAGAFPEPASNASVSTDNSLQVTSVTSDDHACAILWNLPKGQFVRRLSPIRSAPLTIATSSVSERIIVYTENDRGSKDSSHHGGPGALHLFSLNGRPLNVVRPPAHVNRIVCAKDEQVALVLQGSRLVVRRTYDLSVIYAYETSSQQQAQLATSSEKLLPHFPTVEHKMAGPNAVEIANRVSRDPSTGIEILGLSADDHHIFAAISDGSVLIFTNPMLNIQVLEKLASELLNL